MSKVEGRVVIVTGAGRAIARQVALDFAAEGARVVVVDMIEERAKRTVSEIEAAGGTAPAAVWDVGDETAGRRRGGQAVRRCGRAGGGRPAVRRARRVATCGARRRCSRWLSRPSGRSAVSTCW